MTQQHEHDLMTLDVTPEQRTLLMLAKAIDVANDELREARHLVENAQARLAKMEAAVRLINERESWVDTFRQSASDLPDVYEQLRDETQR